MNPSDFTNFPSSSIMNKCEHEVIAQNIMIILERTGNKFRKLSWRQYKQEREKDEGFFESEKPFFNSVVNFCISSKKAKSFSKVWSGKLNED